MEPQAIDTQAIDTQTAAQQPLTTPRLLLRRWQQSDLVPFARLNADPEVMRYFPYRLGRPASDAFVEHIEACFEQQGFGLWAVELREGGDFIGFVGLKQPNFDAHFMPSVEVGWRLARPYWGHGYATEGAQRALTYGFDTAGVDEIVSFTAVVNQRSKAVMARLGMTYCATDDFDHPALPKGHELQRHVLYRMSKSRWQMLQADG
ncbi:MAG: GNAT family N-acetyltransferase [Elainellaceae cyanobacterium]